MTPTPPLNRIEMRAWAQNFRANLTFARKYRDIWPAMHERWVLRAGQSLAEAIRARDEQPIPHSALRTPHS
jgi:hypothetical protein